jgi:Amt family ammonium transporter
MSVSYSLQEVMDSAEFQVLFDAKMTEINEAVNIPAVNTSFVIVSTAMIFLMQAGFALVECGTVRKKNASNILIKNLFDACIGAIAFWLTGYMFAFGL